VSYASVQALRLGIQAIQDGVVTAAEGEFHALLEVSGTVDPFADDAHREAVLAGFSMFLNALGHPVQILVRASPVDLSDYTARLEERAHQTVDGQLAALAHDHAVFVQGVARQRTLLERRFYLVVPAESTARNGWISRLRGGARTTDTDARREAARHQLAFRCEEIARQLARCGLGVRRLMDQELAQLYLACWSPERARAQRFRQQLDDYTTLAVRAASVAQVVA
jgi:hypothetical protein